MSDTAEYTLEELLKLARNLPPMTAAQRREQAISWAWGNLNASSNHRVPRDVVEAVFDRMYPNGYPPEIID